MSETENLGLGFLYHLLADLFPSSSYTFNSLGVLHRRREGRKGKMENHMEPFMLGKSCQIILSARCSESSCWTPTLRIGQQLLKASCPEHPTSRGRLCPWGTTDGGPSLHTGWGRLGAGCSGAHGRKAPLVPQLTVPTTVTKNFAPSTLQERKGRAEFCWFVKLFIIIVVGEMWTSS